MARFGLVGAAYQSEAVNADCQKCVNWYVEQIESGTGASAAALYPTPGMTTFAGPLGSSSTTQVRGSYEFNGRCFVVTDKFYEVFSDGSNDGGHSFPPNDGRPVTMEANSVQQLLVCGGGQMWMYPLVTPLTANIVSTKGFNGPPAGHGRPVLNITCSSMPFSVGQVIYFQGLTTETWLNGLSATVNGISGNTISSYGGTWETAGAIPTWPYGPTTDTGTVGTAVGQQVGVSLGTIEMIAQIDGYFLALQKNSGTFYSSAPEDATTWADSTGTPWSYTVSEFPENIIAFKVLRREIWLFAGKHILPYYDSGDPLTPFQPNPSAFIETGLGAEWAVSKFANTLFWLGADERGRAVAYMANGYTPVRISTHAIENEWANYVQPATDEDGNAVPSITSTISTIQYVPASGPAIDDTLTITTGPLEEIAGGLGVYISLSGLTTHPELNTLSVEVLGSTPGNPGSIQTLVPQGQTGKPGFSTVAETGTISTVTSNMVGIDDAISYALQINGHAFWHVYFPTAQKSWRFDVTTGLWAEVALWDGGDYAPHPTVNHVEVFGRHLLGSSDSPYLIWTDKSLVTDNLPDYPNNPIRRLRRAPHISNELEWEFHHRLRVHLETGLGPMPPLLDGNNAPREPQVMLRWSDDGGHTWSNEYVVGAGMAGDFKRRVEYRRLGRSRDRVYEVSVSDPVPYRLVDAYLFTSPSNQQPMQRYAQQLAKMA